ncbi:hypothetical protein NDU88_006301 [Pleurodeles waltl]|uniref:Uncharacterized protein n=1 Tax=Pleurodeles waltl TaxID=8319 RepID=A0AAV7VQM2_PLEWA|nr:hypothetical protein NDU88_006301 [Pleurodeles waltl]
MQLCLPTHCATEAAANQLLNSITTGSDSNPTSHATRIPDGDDVKVKFRLLEKFMKNEQAKWWEMQSMKKYLEVSHVPHGLRILTTPSYENPNPTMMKEWAEDNIVASKGLMEIIVKYAETDRMDLQSKIDMLDIEINAHEQQEVVRKYCEEMKTRLKKRRT